MDATELGVVEALSPVWPVLGNVFGIAVSLAPWPMMTKVQTSGSVQGIQFFPLISLLLCGWVWAVYGLVVNDIGVVVLNVFMTACAARYVAVYLRAMRDWTPVLVQLRLCALFAIGYTAAAVLLPPGRSTRNQLAIAAAFTSIVSYAAPLAALREIVIMRRPDLLPMPLIVTSAVCAAFWTLHGLARADAAILYCNVFGLLLSLAQIALWVALRTTSGPSLSPAAAAAAPGAAASTPGFGSATLAATGRTVLTV